MCKLIFGEKHNKSQSVKHQSKLEISVEGEGEGQKCPISGKA
jgi:hypothetical protein